MNCTQWGVYVFEISYYFAKYIGSVVFKEYERKVMTINGIEIEVEHKSIKHIHLSVYPPDGRIHVSVPQETSDDQLRMFILSKWVWLSEKIETATSNNIQSPREYVSGEAHYFKGELYRLRVETCNPTMAKVSIQGDYILVRCGKQIQAEKALKQWYREQLRAMLPPLVERWVKRLGTPMPKYDVQAMKQCWGSCNKSKQMILFNLELAKKPLECIEYIVAHEVTHLIERTHTDRFYRLLDTYLPGWERHKKQLDEFPITI
ncbi:MAG: M48 family metallopeptidase [Prevotella sp.]|nr:M48 family metallopeptidase [Prevotella sp.]